MILITGAARSGTSLTARVFKACGANFGPSAENALCENVEIRDRVVKPALAQLGLDPLCQHPLPPTSSSVGQVPSLQARVLAAIPGFEPRAYKGAKMCLMWRSWHEAFPDARWVIVRRADDEIIRSCQRTRFMHRLREREEWREWLAVHHARFDEIRTELGDRAWEIWTIDDFAETGGEGIRWVVEALGLRWNAALVAQAALVRS